MRLLLELALVGLIVAAAWLAYVSVRDRGLRRAHWTTEVRSLDDGRVAVELQCAGQRTLPVATIDPAAEDFSERLAEARAAAREREAALNAARRRD